jgi:hypothetical protein
MFKILGDEIEVIIYGKASLFESENKERRLFKNKSIRLI